MTRPDLTWPRRTPRLELRLPTPESLDAVFAWRNVPEVVRWVLRPRIERDAFPGPWLDSIDNPYDHAAVAHLDGKPIGTISLDVTDALGQHAGESPWERSEGSLGYGVDPAYAGKGFTTEMVEEFLVLAFDDLGLRRITASCFADNTASWRVMEKVGMRREGHRVKNAWHAELGWIDDYLYAILAEEWRAGRGRGRTSGG